MNLSLKSFSALVSDSAAAVQASCAQLLDMSVGSVLRAVLESSASVGLWMQWLIIQVWQGCRLSTSQGADVDSFVNDYGLTRLSGVSANGSVTFSRFAAVSSAVVPLGANVATADLSQVFQVTEDDTNPAWNATFGGYLMAPNAYSVTVPVVSVTTGSVGNVQANAITSITTAIAGVDTVTNAAPLQNGADAESDAALKTRFSSYISTLSRATPAAVAFAIESTQQGLTYSLEENRDTAGNWKPGNFVVVVDDGTGAPSSTLLTKVYSHIDAVRPIGSTFSVLAPAVVIANVSMSIVVGPNGNKALIAAAVKAAITDYIDALSIGSSLPFSVLPRLAWNTDPNITNVTQIALNNGTSDMIVLTTGVIKAGVVSIN